MKRKTLVVEEQGAVQRKVFSLERVGDIRKPTIKFLYRIGEPSATIQFFPYIVGKSLFVIREIENRGEVLPIALEELNHGMVKSLWVKVAIKSLLIDLEIRLIEDEF
jgi:hypothetical protein